MHMKHDLVDIKKCYKKKMRIAEKIKCKLQWSKLDAEKQKENLSDLKQERSEYFKKISVEINKREQALERTVHK